MSAIQNICELSPIQEGMLFHHLKLDEELTYITQIRLTIDGELDVEKLKFACETLVKRHESLRTAFVFEDLDDVVQVILKNRDAQFEYHDMVANNIKNDLCDLAHKEKLSIKDLEKDSLVRFLLIKKAETHYEFYLTCHHIILDGWSLGLLLEELQSIYVQNGEQFVAPSRYQFSNYVKWLKEQDNEFAKTFWKSELTGYENKSLVPYIETRKTKGKNRVKEGEYESYKFELNKELSQSIKAFSKSIGVTQSTFFEVIWGILLQKYNRTSDVVFGRVVSGRQNAIEGVQNIVGLLVNTVPVRLKAGSNDTVISILKDSQEYSIKRDSASFIGLPEIKRTCRHKDSLLDQLFVFENYPIDRSLLSSDKVDEKKIPISNVSVKERTNYPLTIIIVPGETFIVEFSYSQNSLAQKNVSTLAAKYRLLIEKCLNNPQSKIRTIDLLDLDERNRALNVWNKTCGFDKESTIVSLFDEIVSEYSDKTALRYKGESISYKKLDEQSIKIASYVNSKVGTRNKVIGLICDRGPLMIASIIGILKSGCAYLPIDKKSPIERIDYILRDAGCDLLLSDEAINCDYGISVVQPEKIVDNEGEEASKGNVKCTLPKVITSDSLAYVIYTSGSTGFPKGALIEHKNVTRLFFNNKQKFSFSDADVWSGFHSICFDFSVWEIFGALLNGATLVIVPEDETRDIFQYHDLLHKERVSVLSQTPSVFYQLSEIDLQDEKDLNSIRTVVFGGEALKFERLLHWMEKYTSCSLVNMYGITETTVHVTYKELTKRDVELGISNIGKPIPTLKTYILDENMNLLPPHVVGEICVSGAGVCRGYLGMEELTKERFVENPFCPGERLYKSGDLGRWNDSGDIEYIGRLDHQIKVRGFRIETAEIEKQITKHPGLSEAYVLPEKDKDLDSNILVCYMKKDPSYIGDLTVSDIMKYLSLHVAEYMLPSMYFWVDSFPVTINGKIDIDELIELRAPVKKSNDLSTIESKEETDMLNIWKEVLGVDSIFRNDNFFALGGDSLKTIRLVSKIKSKMNLNVSVGDIFTNPSISQLCHSLKEKGSQEDIDRLLEVGKSQNEKFVSILAENHPCLREKLRVADKSYPMTTIETGMIYSSLANELEPIYYDQVVHTIEIKDLEIFRKAVESLVERHNIFRTRYYLNQFVKPIKIVNPTISIPLEIYDDLCVSEEEGLLRIRNYNKNDLKIRLSFNGDLLWRMAVFRLKGDKYSIVFSFHHAMMDGWSKTVLLTDLSKIIEQLENDNHSVLESLIHDYSDYSAISKAKTISSTSIEFWRNRISGYERNKIPFNYSRKQKTKESGIGIKHRIPDKATNQSWVTEFRKISEAHEVSIKSICVSAFIYLLKIITGEKSILAGMVTHDRPAIVDGDKIVGCFLTTVPIRIDLSESTSYLELVKNVNEFIQSAKSNEMHLVDIAQCCGEITSEYNPFFDCIINFTDFHVKSEWHKNQTLPNFGQTEYEGAITGSEMTNTFFDLEVDKTLDEFYIQVKYYPAYFDDSEIEIALDIYVNILNQIADNVATTLDTRRVIDSSRLQSALTDFNDTHSDYSDEKTITTLISEKAREYPVEFALVFRNQTLTYRELENRTNEVASYLYEKGARAEDRIGLVSSRGFDMVVAMLGILKIGAAYIPIDPSYPLSRQFEIISSSAPNLLLIDKHTSESNKLKEKSLAEGIILEFLTMEDINSITSESINFDENTDSGKVAYIIYTSGSTGRPKGVTINHNSVINLIEWVNSKFAVNSKDTILCVTSMCFDLSVYDIFGGLGAGATVVIADENQCKDPNEQLDLIRSQNVTFWNSVPSTLNNIVSHVESSKEWSETLNSLRLMFLSGDWIPLHLPKSSKRIFPQAEFVSLGGATEATVWSNYHIVHSVDPNWDSIPYGKPISNTRFYVLDDQQTPVPQGVVGELYIAGIGVARCYHADEERTNNSFYADCISGVVNEKMYRTGDLGCINGNGVMELVGRVDSQVKIAGFRIELGEIEHQMEKMESIAASAVIVDSKDKLDSQKRLVCFYVSNADVDKDDIRRNLLSVLPSYMVPNIFIRLDALPLNTNGKIDRAQLTCHISDVVTLDEEIVLPQSETEIRISRIWNEILQSDQISCTSNFFESGGSSLNVPQMSAMIEEEFSVSIPLVEYFENPTVKEIADVVDKELNCRMNVTKREEVFEEIEL